MGAQFCRECNNLLYPKMEAGILQYVCNRCETTADPAHSVIVETCFKAKHGTSLQLNQDLMCDVTLPRFSKRCARCSHGECLSYMEKSDEKALNSYYVCAKCFYEWTD